MEGLDYIANAAAAGGAAAGETVGPGTYRSTRPLPVYDNWKSTLRLHKGATVAGLPIYMPEARRSR